MTFNLTRIVLSAFGFLAGSWTWTAFGAQDYRIPATFTLAVVGFVLLLVVQGLLGGTDS